jgi:2-desacetyl-2-hydroxyethyl bacteriochlorophyllide A dehydrogenase
MKSHMKAAEIVSTKKIQIAESLVPELTDDQVLVRVKYAGICGTDLKIYDGTIPYVKQGLLKYPVIPGHEWSGEVVKTGPKVAAFQKGDRVTGECHIGCAKCDDCISGRANICPNRIRMGIINHNGAFAQYAVVPERALHRLPPTVSDLEGALVEPLTIALYALDKLDTVAGSHILVFGLGPIGILVSQVAKAMGAAYIIGVDVDENRLELGKRLGCDSVTSQKGEGLIAEIEKITGGHGVDIVVEATGVKSLLALAVDLIRPGGQISLLGLYDGKVEFDATQAITKDLKIYGNMASARVWERAIKLIASRRVDVKALVTHQFPFEEIPQAMHTAYYKLDDSLKVIVKI